MLVGGHRERVVAAPMQRKRDTSRESRRESGRRPQSDTDTDGGRGLKSTAEEEERDTGECHRAHDRKRTRPQEALRREMDKTQRNLATFKIINGGLRPRQKEGKPSRRQQRRVL